jgi:hypothetical protein
VPFVIAPKALNPIPNHRVSGPVNVNVTIELEKSLSILIDINEFKVIVPVDFV